MRVFIHLLQFAIINVGGILSPAPLATAGDHRDPFQSFGGVDRFANGVAFPLGAFVGVFFKQGQLFGGRSVGEWREIMPFRGDDFAFGNFFLAEGLVLRFELLFDLLAFLALRSAQICI